ncbi:FAD-dependent oxidoreductase [Streptomyces niveiscabiei]|uniref:FAD-dependent oxidoreductase n=1 Tax=Streptomyces niveiscabiei TaxID=164115 RepID=UPI0029A87AD3|nr:FAD-dependent oxidoreductase [Streptomyces niveiscabiei]MDX3382095.1 FAD-dependent oxidoreductase [Streptomyces niveiscabiei]
MNRDVVIIGAGVVGLTTGVVLAERGWRVRVWAREVGEATTSAVAGGLWWPYHIEPRPAARAWALESLDVYRELARRGGAGVRMAEGVLGGTSLDEVAWLEGAALGLRACTPGEYAAGSGLWARLPLVDMAGYLPWLRGRLADAGGRVEVRTVTGLADADVPVVVNCAGLGARELADDPEVHPVRGQLVVVENPGIDHWTVSDGADGSLTYFFPQPGRLLLGGTAEEGAWSLVPDPAVAEAIVQRCARLRPEIAGARVLGHRVGLRPARGVVRLERGVLGDGRVVVHHYGHGGAGVTVAWGCAREAAGLVEGGVGEGAAEVGGG